MSNPVKLLDGIKRRDLLALGVGLGVASALVPTRGSIANTCETYPDPDFKCPPDELGPATKPYPKNTEVSFQDMGTDSLMGELWCELSKQLTLADDYAGMHEAVEAGIKLMRRHAWDEIDSSGNVKDPAAKDLWLGVWGKMGMELQKEKIGVAEIQKAWRIHAKKLGRDKAHKPQLERNVEIAGGHLWIYFMQGVRKVETDTTRTVSIQEGVYDEGRRLSRYYVRKNIDGCFDKWPWKGVATCARMVGCRAAKRAIRSPDGQASMSPDDYRRAWWAVREGMAAALAKQGIVVPIAACT